MSAHRVEVLREAYNEVKEKGVAIRAAARRYGLAEATLRRRINHGIDAYHPLSGFSTILSRTQEEHLAEHCVAMAHLGYGFTRWQVLDIAKNMCDVLGIETTPTKHWFYGFLGRFPEVGMVKPKRREKVRDEAITAGTLNAYFNELENTLRKYDLLNKPTQIWNVDESGISVDHNPPKVLAAKGSSVFSITSGRSSTTTVISAGSALGETVPPYIIYKGQRLSKNLTTGGLKGTEYRVSPTGWSNSSLFLDFFQNHFLHHIKVRPVILLYDGHSTHVTQEVIEAARQENVHLFVLPPHSSHCLQPLDVAVFSPFKTSLNSEIHKYLHSHPNQVVTLDQLPGIIATAYKSAMTVPNIMAGFRKAGIFPLDRTIITTEAPSISNSMSEKNHTRKERKDNRTIKMLFEEKKSEFITKKTAATLETQRKKRKSFVPPFGATITEESFYQQRKNITNKKSVKRSASFTPPFISETQEEPTGSSVGVGLPKTAKVTVVENESPGMKKSGKGCSSSSKKGKAPAKKRQQIENESYVDEDDDELCVVCGKWQPDGLRLDISLKFVQWGQCVLCNKWVHLKFCCDVEHLSEEDSFLCPDCQIEP